MLPGSFDALIDHMLDLLENKHGKDLVRSAMMFVASARFALSQAELLQLLLSDDSLRADLDGLVDIDSELFAKVPTSLSLSLSLALFLAVSLSLSLSLSLARSLALSLSLSLARTLSLSRSLSLSLVLSL